MRVAAWLCTPRGGVAHTAGGRRACDAAVLRPAAGRLALRCRHPTQHTAPHTLLPQVLSQRAEEEVALLPFASETAAHAAIDARNARYRLSIPWVPAGGDASPDRDSYAQEGEGPYSPNTISKRLVKAEKAAEQFVARRLQPAVQRTAGLVKETSPEGVVQGLKSSELGHSAAAARRGRIVTIR